MVVMIAITVVATVATAGAAAAAMSSAGLSSFSMALGAQTLAHGSVMAAAAGGFVGSVAGQLAGKAMGVVDSFSLKNALASGLTAGATAGMGNILGAGQTFQGAQAAQEASKAGMLGRFATVAKDATVSSLNIYGKMALGASATAFNMAANKLAGNHQASFQWRNVVSSTATAGAMHGMGVTNTGLALERFAGNEALLGGSLHGIVGAAIGYGINKGLYNQGSWNFRNVATDAFGNALGNSIVTGLSAKSGPSAENGKLSAKEQADLDQKMAAMDKKIQAKLNGQSGISDPVIQMQSKNGVLVPQGSNAVEIFDWYKENGLLDDMDDQQYHQLALAANAYEGKQFARIKASMDYSQMLQQDLMRKQYSVDASAYRLAELTHEMKYYALGGHNGVFDQYGEDRKVSLIPWRPEPPQPATLLEQYVSYSSQDVTPILAAQSTLSNSLFARSLYDTAQRGITTLTNPGADIFKLGNHMVILDGSQRPGFNPNQVLMDSQTVRRGLTATGVFTNALKSGAGMGGLLAPVGTAIEYSIQGKPVMSEAFMKDASVDVFKGFASGAVGGAITTGVIGVAAITAGAIGAPIVAGAAVLGFLGSWAFGEYVFDPKIGDDMKALLKNR